MLNDKKINVSFKSWNLYSNKDQKLVISYYQTFNAKYLFRNRIGPLRFQAEALGNIFQQWTVLIKVSAPKWGRWVVAARKRGICDIWSFFKRMEIRAQQKKLNWKGNKIIIQKIWLLINGRFIWCIISSTKKQILQIKSN